MCCENKAVAIFSSISISRNRHRIPRQRCEVMGKWVTFHSGCFPLDASLPLTKIQWLNQSLSDLFADWTCDWLKIICVWSSRKQEPKKKKIKLWIYACLLAGARELLEKEKKVFQVWNLVLACILFLYWADVYVCGFGVLFGKFTLIHKLE